MATYLECCTTKELLAELVKRTEIEVLQTSYPDKLYVGSKKFNRCYTQTRCCVGTEMCVIVVNGCKCTERKSLRERIYENIFIR